MGFRRKWWDVLPLLLPTPMLCPLRGPGSRSSGSGRGRPELTGKIQMQRRAFLPNAQEGTFLIDTVYDSKRKARTTILPGMWGIHGDGEGDGLEGRQVTNL